MTRKELIKAYSEGRRTFVGANLNGADLRGADLSRADLSRANLSRANLSRANLSYADLSGANLSYADLSGADLRYTNLSYADLSGARGLAQQVIAGEGVLVGYKKTLCGGIVTLCVPAAAARVNAYGSRKCRAEYAVVVDAPAGSVSRFDGVTKYVAKRRVTPDSYDPDPRVECSHGIHFFITRAEAEAY
jgi:uncharacterized protein YjbI with pentapeptide repeats